ncbi:MAG: class I tRNA ligase family protein [Candidatus Enteromonas sp.]|nr:class I tRNA ligase family protein [Candidatus Enteromonas sp.]
MILGENGEKMSKSRGNVVNPDDIIVSHGADSLRLFEMFAGPLNEVKPWSPTGLDGAKRFIERSFRLVDEETFVSRISDENSGELDFSYNAMVKKCTEDYESLAFNTAISAMMVFVNDVYKAKSIYRPYIEGFTKILSCVCPFVGEEMWEKLGHKDLITYEQWPTFDEKKLVLDTVNMVFAVNGKMRDVVEVDKSLDDETLKSMALSNEKVKNFIADKTVRKVIVVKGKIVNVVVG